MPSTYARRARSQSSKPRRDLGGPATTIRPGPLPSAARSCVEAAPIFVRRQLSSPLSPNQRPHPGSHRRRGDLSIRADEPSEVGPNTSARSQGNATPNSLLPRPDHSATRFCSACVCVCENENRPRLETRSVGADGARSVRVALSGKAKTDPSRECESSDDESSNHRPRERGRPTNGPFTVKADSTYRDRGTECRRKLPAHARFPRGGKKRTKERKKGNEENT